MMPGKTDMADFKSAFGHRAENPSIREVFCELLVSFR